MAAMGWLGYVCGAALVLVGGAAEPALAQARGAREDLARHDLATAALLAAVAGWIALLVLRERWGRRPTGEAAFGGEHERPDHPDVPDDSPAVAATLIHGGTITGTALGSIVLDLARRGYVRIVEEDGGAGRAPGAPRSADGSEEPEGGDPDWLLVRSDTPGGDLRPYENAIFARLFGVANETRLSSLVAWAGSNRQQAATFLVRLRRSVLAELQERGYLERGDRLPVAANAGVAGAVAVLGLVALVRGSPLGLVALASGLAQLALGRTLRRRTISGSRRAREWTEVRRALEAADERVAPEEDPEMWERSLVYACALEVAEPFLEGLRRHGSSLDGEFRLADWYEGAGSTHRLASMGRFTETFGRTLVEGASGARGSASPGPAVGRLSAWGSRSR